MKVLNASRRTYATSNRDRQADGEFPRSSRAFGTGTRGEMGRRTQPAASRYARHHQQSRHYGDNQRGIRSERSGQDRHEYPSADAYARWRHDGENPSERHQPADGRNRYRL